MWQCVPGPRTNSVSLSTSRSCSFIISKVLRCVRHVLFAKRKAWNGVDFVHGKSNQGQKCHVIFFAANGMNMGLRVAGWECTSREAK